MIRLHSRRFAVAALLGLTLLSGVVHGYLDGRWTIGTDKQAVGDQLHDLPETLGDWTLVESGNLEENALQMLRCYGSFLNVYRHNDTKALVNVAVMYGPRGPIAVHTPEVCYSSQGTDLVRERRVETISVENQENRFWSVEFVRDNDPSSAFEVWYGWSDGGSWVAAENPRYWMTDDLYKIQLSGPASKTSFSACKSFLTALLPHLEQHIK
ncbi:EpsI family protein [Stieleria sp. TO1_6]|uniref:exosortase-associated EpsI family protein n=1 Tax=Stieleria tagensis TaxID=2956795 RepID=UPI00209BAE4E|nr:exosortase-associated EpsI family protein [Stieleria tagensis]MCO8122488.1 EpsI family protein [Stieleria tagensis]